MAAGKLRVICGPTAAGKSAIALDLAEEYDAAIVSADSRQVYCGFDIGTAKPTRQECARVTHYGIDVAEPDERFSAARWAAEAEEWIESAGEINKEPVVVGGTGLYIKALVEPLSEVITPRAGLLVAFPATVLHEVAPVLSGTRDVIVDWFY